tara:strand:+ start:1255 stop:1497 length:243 start_codon:yes stop_codon:yes gene_type:complete
MQTAPTQKRPLYVHFDKSPMGYNVFHKGRKHPVGYLKTVGGYGSDRFFVIHNGLSTAEQSVPRPLDEAKKLITDLINGRC